MATVSPTLEWVEGASRPAGGIGTPSTSGARATPARAGIPRDLAQWKPFPIDPAIPSGHGFVLHDLDGTELLDLVINADWDTFGEEQAVLVYQNPGWPESITAPRRTAPFFSNRWC